MAGPGSNDKMVEAAIWLLVQGDRAGAEDLLSQVLKQDPTHERARQAMKSVAAPTSPGQQAPKPPLPHQTVNVVPPAQLRATLQDNRVQAQGSTPLEPVPALARRAPASDTGDEDADAGTAPTARTRRGPGMPGYAEADAATKQTLQYAPTAVDADLLKAAKAARDAMYAPTPRDGSPGLKEPLEVAPTTSKEDAPYAVPPGLSLKRANTMPDAGYQLRPTPGPFHPPGLEVPTGENEVPVASAPARRAELPSVSTALDVSLQAALNDRPPPGAVELPQVESTSRVGRDGTTDRHLTLVPPQRTGTSSTQPQLLPVRDLPARPPPPLGAGAPRITGNQAPLQVPWTLEVLTGPNSGTRISMTRKPVVLGLGMGPVDFSADPFVSAAHASFFVRGSDLFVSDGGGPSGTWHTLDGSARVPVGESFSVGLQRLRFLGALERGSQPGFVEYGAPVPAAMWRLEHVLVGARPGRTWLLRGIVTVGRRGTTVSFPDDMTLADLHAELRPAGAELEVVDRSQGGGTFVCVPSGGERRVTHGMRVRLGATLLQISNR